MSGSDITYSTYGGNQFPVVATATEESLDIVSGSTEMYNMTSSSASSVIDSWMSLKYNLASVIVVGVALTLVTAATALGNLLVGLALVRYQRLRTMSNCLIGNLALSDFLLAVTVLPLSVANEILGHWIFGRLACKTWLIIDVLYCTASIWNLCVIAADRFTATMYPLWYRDRRSTTRAILYIAVVWAVAGATCVPPLIGWTGDNYVYDDTTASYQCMPFSDASYVIYSASTSFFVPFLVTCVLYSWIFVVLRRRMRAMRARRKSEAAAATSTSCGPSKRVSVGMPTFSFSNNGSGATGSRFWTRHWNRLRRKCASIRATTTPVGEGKHNNGSEPQEQEDSSAGKSAYVTEYSDEKSSVADTEADLASMSLDFDSSKSPFSLRSATHFRFTSVRRPFQNRSPRDGSGRARFRFTISGRHDSHIRRGSMMTSTSGDNHLTSADVRPEVWTLSPVNAANCVTWHHENTSTSLVQSLSNENVENKNSNAINASIKGTSAISDGHRPVDGTTNELQPLQVVNVATSEQPNESDVIKFDGDVGQNGAVTPPKTAPTLSGKDDKGGGDGDVLPQQQLPTIRQTDRRCSKAFALVAASLSRKSAPTNQQQAKQRDRSERREMRATIRMAAIIGMFGAMWIGFFVSYVANGVTNGDIRLPPSVDAFLFWLGYVNSTVNPILYAVFNADFRRAFQRILAGCCCCQAGVRMLRPSASSRSRGAGPAGRRASSRRQRPRRPCRT